jgi:tripartite-type tricarboxylate transporter receptor subunit TctC
MLRTEGFSSRVLLGLTCLLLAYGIACRQPSSGSTTSASTAEPGAAKPTVSVDKAKMAEYFKGKTIELFIGYAPGGGYDIRGRLFADYFSKYIPGNPQVVIQNLAGGGGLQATRQVMRSKPDGLTLVTIPSGLYVNELLGVPQEGFSMAEPMKLGNYETAANQYTVMFSRTSVATSWQEVADGGKQGKRFKYGAPAVGNTQAMTGEWLAAIGAPIDMVYGYGGSNELLSAMDRGEVDLYNTDAPADTKDASFVRIQQAYPEWLKASPPFVTPILSTRTSAPQAWFDPFGWKAPPNLMEVVQASQAQKDGYTLAFKVREAFDPISAPKGTPDDIYQTLKEATRQAAEDPEYKKGMAQRGFDGGYRSPEDMDEGLKALQGAPPETLAVVRRMYTGEN